jgi:hypothetical protein
VKPGIGTILVSLLGGVLLAVAVAWHCILAGPVARGKPQFIAAHTDSGSIRQFVLMHSASRTGVRQMAYTATSSVAWFELELEVGEEVPDTPSWAPWPDEADLPPLQTRLHVAAGWPMACLAADCIEQDARLLPDRIRLPEETRRRAMALSKRLPSTGKPLAAAPPRWRHAIVVHDQQSSGPFTAVVLPYRPIPMGLVANTLLYASLVAFVLLGCSALLRLMRRRRGKCPLCCYQLKGGMVNGCPECGWHRATFGG